MHGNHHTGLGIALAALAFAFYSTMDMLVKLLSAGYPLSQIIFFLCLFGLVPLSLLLFRSGGWKSLKSQRLGLHLARGALGLGGGFCSFFAYSRMPLANAYAIAFSAPLFITALSVPFLGEHVGWRRWTAVAVGFAGVMIMIRPGMNALDLGTLGAVGGALSYAFSVLLLRRMTRTESSAAQMFYPTLFSLVATGLIQPFEFVRPSAIDLGFLALMGFCGGLGQICLIRSIALADAAVVAPFQYSQILWGMLFGYLLWSDRPDAWMLLGAGVVILSGVYILHREILLKPAVTTTPKGIASLGAPVSAPPLQTKTD